MSFVSQVPASGQATLAQLEADLQLFQGATRRFEALANEMAGNFNATAKNAVSCLESAIDRAKQSTEQVATVGREYFLLFRTSKLIFDRLVQQGQKPAPRSDDAETLALQMGKLSVTVTTSYDAVAAGDPEALAAELGIDPSRIGPANASTSAAKPKAAPSGPEVSFSETTTGRVVTEETVRNTPAGSMAALLDPPVRGQAEQQALLAELLANPDSPNIPALEAALDAARAGESQVHPGFDAWLDRQSGAAAAPRPNADDNPSAADDSTDSSQDSRPHTDRDSTDPYVLQIRKLHESLSGAGTP